MSFTQKNIKEYCVFFEYLILFLLKTLIIGGNFPLIVKISLPKRLKRPRLVRGLFDNILHLPSYKLDDNERDGSDR